MPKTKLLSELRDYIHKHIDFAERIKSESDEKLNFRPSDNAWSSLECIEHLNRYGNFYIPEINKKIAESNFPNQLNFSPGFLGNYFANSMLPKKKINTMKTLKSMNPIHSTINRDVIDEFIRQQKCFLQILEKAELLDLNRIKTSISISKLIKLKLGDTLRFNIYHNERHIQQIIRLGF